MTQILVKAPSNIAWVKYMGKRDAKLNLPENASLSMTLDSLCTWADVRVLEKTPESEIRWVAELPHVPREFRNNLRLPQLSERGIGKVIAHVERTWAAAPELLEPYQSRYDFQFVRPAGIELRTANTFPEASGIASSASAFAAVTLAAVSAAVDKIAHFKQAWKNESELRKSFASISRQGSGSSCRSLDGPFVRWENDCVESVVSELGELVHFVIVVSSEAKAISSSEAHLKVRSSPLWNGRPERANRRVVELRAALMSGNWNAAVSLAWADAWEMHSLFHTSVEPFTYWRPGSVEALNWFAENWMNREGADLPLVTLDAGPNVHITVRKEFSESWKQKLEEKFGRAQILCDRMGAGAEIIEVGA